jgi:hypothetical protein
LGPVLVLAVTFRREQACSPAKILKVLLCLAGCRFWIEVVPLVVDFSFGQALHQQFGFPLACIHIQDFL